MRVRPSINAAAMRMAQEDNLSLARWLEWVIEADAARLKGRRCAGRGRSPDEACWRKPGLFLAQPQISRSLHPGYGY
jgi:hypothetical protein